MVVRSPRYLGWASPSKSVSRWQTILRFPAIFVARTLGVMPFGLHVESAGLRVTMSKLYLVYSLIFATFLTAVMIYCNLINLENQGRFLLMKFYAPVRINSTWLIVVTCIFRRRAIWKVLQPLYLYQTHTNSTFALYLTVLIVYIVGTMWFSMTDLAKSPEFFWDYGSYLFQQYIAVIIPVFLASVISECLDSLTREFADLRSEINEVGLFNQKVIYVFMPNNVSRFPCFKAKYIRLVKIGRALEDAFDIQIVLVVVMVFMQVLTKVFYAMNQLNPGSLICRFGSSALLLAKLALLLRSYEQTTKSLRDLSIQLLHLRLRFTACGFFPLDYTQLRTVIAAVATYVVILLQTQLKSTTLSAAPETVEAAAKVALVAFKNVASCCGVCGGCCNSSGVGVTPR